MANINLFINYNSLLFLHLSSYSVISTTLPLSQICGYFFVNITTKLLSPEKLFSAQNALPRPLNWIEGSLRIREGRYGVWGGVGSVATGRGGEGRGRRETPKT